MALDIKKFLPRFTGEARDHLGRLEAGLAPLASGAGLDGDSINELFRAAHTIKGSARMLKLTGIADTAHQLEEVLGALREGRIRSNPELGALLMRSLDAIGALVEQVEPNAGQIPDADEALCAALAAAAEGNLAESFSPSPQPISREGRGAESASSATESEPTRIAAPSPSTATPSGTSTPTQPVPTPTEPPSEEPARDAPTALRAPDSVRVRMDKLDELIKLMGEVVSNQAKLRRNLLEARTLDKSLAALASAETEPDRERLTAQSQAMHGFTLALRDLVQEQERLTTELNDRALVMRMLPLAIVFEPIAPLARQLGRELGKEVHCEISGGEIELDRQLIDHLSDALVHLLRNAVDHGLESPDERQAAGKPRLGRLRLSARQEGVGVLIEIEDDGRGLDRERILAKAIQKGLIDPARAPALDDEAVENLCLLPGFSTSAIITDISGRGVGLDVVKRAIVEDLRGSLSISSRPGSGTRFGLQLPASLAVMRVLLFEAGGRAFGLTARQVAELIRVPRDQTLLVGDRPAMVLRNEFLPLVQAGDLPALQITADEPSGAGWLVVVIQSRQTKLGLVVDRLLDERDMVIKPLPAHLRAGGLVAGMVVTGDNALVSILQAPALLEMARRLRGETPLVNADRRAPHQTPGGQRILVVDDSLNTREIEREILEAYGYRVTLAEDGLDGWQKALGGHFDAVITDVDMPGMDGFSLTTRLRGHEQYRSTPIVIVTSRQKPEDKQRGIQVGADAYIVKGDFNQSSLVDTLMNLLG
ncbi:hybrid sensor histidine kinase/response regulator [Allochromatium tepidum]|uniref:Chemotaxis protein CheA n=1 Tax=Allochromatium tepidum TaxID=553982 RepID=A0ABM7QMH4_9GAMM|nr:hybrid sensor histidine kinase/response regulator [Allochromatium tepidum]BCU06938.1 hybrid sensor histidine kinase/response regulator [Allochromatium tepidum]